MLMELGAKKRGNQQIKDLLLWTQTCKEKPWG